MRTNLTKFGTVAMLNICFSLKKVGKLRNLNGKHFVFKDYE